MQKAKRMKGCIWQRTAPIWQGIAFNQFKKFVQSFGHNSKLRELKQQQLLLKRKYRRHDATQRAESLLLSTEKQKRTSKKCLSVLLAEEEDSFNSGAGEFTRKSGVSTQTNSADALLCYAQTLRVDCFAMSASHGKCKCCALALSVARSQSDGVRVAHKCAVQRVARKSR